MNTPSEVKLISLKNIVDSKGSLTIFESKKDVPFHINRCFTVKDVPENSTRGQHAHKYCEQFVVCMNGSLNCKWHNGSKWNSCVLNNSCEGLYVPAGNWLELMFEEKNIIVMVLCDQPYREDDYVRDWEIFKSTYIK